MLTILQINLCANAGSTGMIAGHIGTAAMERGWRSYIAAGRTIKEGSSELIAIGGKSDVYLHGVRTRLCDRHGFGSAAATRKLVEQIAGIKPDVIHLHNIHGYYLNIEILFGYLAAADIPVIWTLHDCWPFTGHCAHFENAGCHRWKSGCGGCPLKGNYPRSLFLDNSDKNYRDKKWIFNSVPRMTIVPVSGWLHSHLKESFLAGYPSKVIHNWVDTDTFKPAPKTAEIRRRYGAEDKLLVLGVASAWTAEKGLHDFIRLGGLLGDRARILLVGLSPKQVSALPDGITGLTRIEDMNELAALYSASDVFLNPTYNESFSLTNIEAQSCGTPVITYRAGGAPETVCAETGFVVEKGDIGAVAAACEEIAGNGKREYSRACRGRAVNLFHKRDKCGEYIDLYEGVIK